VHRAERDRVARGKGHLQSFVQHPLLLGIVWLIFSRIKGLLRDGHRFTSNPALFAGRCYLSIPTWVLKCAWQVWETTNTEASTRRAAHRWLTRG
jgi:hypothetical protein